MKNEAILVHGWDPNYYNSKLPPATEETGWSHRNELIRSLEKQFRIKYIGLPGFCGVPEPVADSFNVEDFADYFAQQKNSLSQVPRVIIGYSFGGAVTLFYKAKYKDPTPLVLVSPALVRQSSTKSTLAKFIKGFLPQRSVPILKQSYQFLMSDYYRSGTPFLRSSYDRIVREDLSDLLSTVPAKQLCFIYGEIDEDTPWRLVKDQILNFKHQYNIIAGGGHNIGATHPDLIASIVKAFIG